MASRSAEGRDDLRGEELHLAHLLLPRHRPWSKNQANHSSSPSLPIRFSASNSASTWSTVPANAYFALHIRSTVHSEVGSMTPAGYLAASSGIGNVSQKPKPPK